jgi:glycosyltransferase involved in cell wall biosynthesis
MRILVLATESYGAVGGIAKFNRDLLCAVCSHPHANEVVALPRRLSGQRLVIPENLTYRETRPGKPAYVSAAIREILGCEGFDLIICAHINLLPVAWLAKLWTAAPIALVIHGIDAWQPGHSRLVNSLAGKVDAYIAVSDLTLERFFSWARARSGNGWVLPNAINMHEFSPGCQNALLMRRYGLTGRTVMMTLARLSNDEQYKGVDEVLELLPDLIREVPDLAYLVVGEGTDRSRLQIKAANLGIDGHVVFTGAIAESEKADHYRLADAFVMPGRGEGFGIVYLEALACGVPVLASKLDGSREAVRDGMLGILVDPDDRMELKTGILRTPKRPRGVVSEGLEYFSYSNFERRTHAIIDRIHGQGLTVTV